MNVLLTRKKSGPDGTFGRMTGMDFDFQTLELPFIDLDENGLGDPQKSCITPGEYQCVWKESPKYGWAYEVTGVQGRSHILIHAANFQYQLLGCIALGKRTGVMPNLKGRAQKALLSSKQAIKEFHEATQGEPFTLKIEWEQ